MTEKTILNYPVFDGVRFYKSATVVVENGVISKETVLGEGEGDSGSNLFLMPGLIDGHTHLRSERHLRQLVQNGVTTTCDVCVPEELRSSDTMNIWTSCTMALGSVTDGSAYVKKAIARGADYIKVILEKPARMAPGTMKYSVLCDIVSSAHAQGLKVVVHAVTVEMVQMAVDAGVDILLHVPMREEFPLSLAQKIAQQGIAVVPTLVMMEAFSRAIFFGYKRSDYANAEAAVRLLHSQGADILVGTDANDVVYAPNVSFGPDLHREMKLLVDAGLTPLEVLQGATAKAAAHFDLGKVGKIAPGYRADLILVEGRPDTCITDSFKIKQVWVGGKPILEGKGVQ